MIFVTGGTGFVGTEVVRGLRKAGHRVRVLARKADSRSVAALVRECGVEVVEGNLDDKAALERGCAGAQAVVHLVGIIHEIGAQSFDRVHHQGTAHVLAAAQRTGVTRFLHMSALGTRENAVSAYHKSKWAAEELVRKSGLCWTIFRPAIIFGKGDPLTTGLVKLMRPPMNWLTGHALPMIDDGGTPVAPVHVRDVAGAFVAALANPAAVGRTYELGGPQLSFREYLEAVARAEGLNPGVVETHPAVMAVAAPLLVLRGHRPVLLPVPARLAKVAAGLFECVSPVPLLTPGHVAMLEEAQVPTTGPAEKDLGFAPRAFVDEIGALVQTVF